MEVAVSAAGAIGSIGGERALSFLRHLWEREELSPSLRRCIVGSLGQAGDRHALEIIDKAIDRGWRYGGKGVGTVALLGIARQNWRDPKVASAVRSRLRKLILDPLPAVREPAAEALGWVGEEADIPVLQHLMETDSYRGVVAYADGSPDRLVYTVREAAEQAITEIRKRLAVPEGSEPSSPPVPPAR